MTPAIIPFLNRRQYKPGFYTNTPHRFTFRRNPPLFLFIQMNQTVIRAQSCGISGHTNPHRICLHTKRGSTETAFPAYSNLLHLFYRLKKLTVASQQSSHFKQYRSSSPDPHQTGTPLSVCIPYPDSDNIIRIHSHSPGISEPETRTGFPGQIQ